MSNNESQPDRRDPEQHKIFRLERLLRLAKEFRAALSMPALAEALDSNLAQIMPAATWDLLLPDLTTGNFQTVKHSVDRSAMIGQTLFEHPDFKAFVSSQSPPATLPGSGHLSTEMILNHEHPIHLLSLVVEARLIGILVIRLTEGPMTSGQREDLGVIADMLGHTLHNVQTYEQLHQQNITDDLTGLFNARHFHHLVDYEIERSKRYGHDLSLIFIDLDNFKRVNDTYGHLVGSALLAEVGRFFEHNMRKINLACRYGGDEFAILLHVDQNRPAGQFIENLSGRGAVHFP